MQGRWRTRCDELPRGRGVRLSWWEGAAPVSWRHMLQSWADAPEAGAAFGAALAGLPFAAMRFECPALSEATLQAGCECVALDAPDLLGAADSGPFADHFAAARAGAQVLCFDNIGGDAVMVVPTPLAPAVCYAHLASFLRGAAALQIGAFFACMAEEARQAAAAGPVWMSTAGGGVAWVHGRLDTRPKYYQHAPYRRRDPAP